MIDTIKHLLGLCGEPHLNINSIILLIILFRIAVYNYKTYKK